MSDWIRRNYDGVGVTQAPPGPHLAAVQDHYLGKVILCIDVSGSMSTVEGGASRLDRAVAGARRFVAEAVAAHYQVGLVLWSHRVDVSVPLATDPRRVLKALDRAAIYGGTDVTPALRRCTEALAGLTGDRVIAVFGDGDIGPVKPAVRAARAAAERGIRIIVRGLGKHAAAALSQIATEDGGAAALVSRAEHIEDGIASMVTSITGRLGRRR